MHFLYELYVVWSQPILGYLNFIRVIENSI